MANYTKTIGSTGDYATLDAALTALISGFANAVNVTFKFQDSQTHDLTLTGANNDFSTYGMSGTLTLTYNTTGPDGLLATGTKPILINSTTLSDVSNADLGPAQINAVGLTFGNSSTSGRLGLTASQAAVRATDVIFDNCMVIDSTAQSSGTRNCLNAVAKDARMATIRNCIGYQNGTFSGGSKRILLLQASAGVTSAVGNLVCYNNTVYISVGSTVGIGHGFAVGTTLNLDRRYNTVVGGTACFGSIQTGGTLNLNASEQRNVSSDATAPGSNSSVSVATASTEWSNAATGFTLKSTARTANIGGTAVLTTDMCGVLRPQDGCTDGGALSLQNRLDGNLPYGGIFVENFDYPDGNLPSGNTIVDNGWGARGADLTPTIVSTKLSMSNDTITGTQRNIAFSGFDLTKPWKVNYTLRRNTGTVADGDASVAFGQIGAGTYRAQCEVGMNAAFADHFTVNTIRNGITRSASLNSAFTDNVDHAMEFGWDGFNLYLKMDGSLMANLANADTSLIIPTLMLRGQCVAAANTSVTFDAMTVQNIGYNPSGFLNLLTLGGDLRNGARGTQRKWPQQKGPR